MIGAFEDALSEAVVTKLLSGIRPDLSISQSLPKRGKTYIASKARDLNRTAANVPVFILVDLDRPDPCPADLIRQMLGGTANAQLLFRVAVIEIESWVLADREAFAEFLAIGVHRIPAITDEIADPKQLLVNLARGSRRRDIREDLVPKSGSTATVGPAFNPRLTEFVRQTWEGERAANASPSLRRAVTRLREAFN